MNEKPVLTCPSCSSKKVHKMPSLCGIVVKSSVRTQKVFDSMRRESEMRSDLKENFGIEKVAPFAGQSLRDVYEDIKNRGSAVKEEMQATTEQSAKKKKEKRREWTRKANKRATSRRIEMAKRKAAEESAKRRIVI
jgi:hypothetical protein